MTYEDTIAKSFISFLVLIVGAVAGWVITSMNPALGMGMITVAGIGAFVLAMVNIFKKEPVPALILAYAALEGFFSVVSHWSLTPSGVALLPRLLLPPSWWSV
jgi:uncharacterized YccA/Bax inhibitor family protein